MANIIAFAGKTPQIAETAFIAPNATIIGDVIIEDGANIWFGAVLRADWNQIHIGARTSIQDNCVLHVNSRYPTIVRENVIVGHGAVLEGCDIGAGSLVGMNATVLSGAKLGVQTILGAGALVRERSEHPARVLLAGVPAMVKRTLSEDEAARPLRGIEHYQDVMRLYAGL